VIDVTRSGSGSNAFFGFDGQATGTLGGGGTMNVGNDLAIQFGGAGGTTVNSRLTVGTPAGTSSQGDATLNVGGDLLVGPNSGGATGTLQLENLAVVDVDGDTQIRAGGRLIQNAGSELVTRNFQSRAGAELTFNGGLLEINSGLGEFQHGDLVVGTSLTETQTARVRAVSGGVIRIDEEVRLAGGPLAGELEVRNTGSRVEMTDPDAVTSVGIDGGRGALRSLFGGAMDLGRTLVIGEGIGSSGLVLINGADGGGGSSIELANRDLNGRVTIGAANATGFLSVRDQGTFGTGGEIRLGDGSNLATVGASLSVQDAGSSVTAARVRSLSNRSLTTIQDGGVLSATDFFQLEAGTLDIDGGGVLLTPHLILTPTSDAGVTIAGGGILQAGRVTEDLVIRSGGIFRPDAGVGLADELIGEVTVTADLFLDDAILEIDLAGTTAGVSHDRVTADFVNLGQASTLKVNLVDGFAPTLGDEFEFFLANGFLGTFAEVDAPTLTGDLGFILDYGLDRLTLLVVEAAGIVGDYNDDDLVGQADLNLVLQNWGDARLYEPNGDPFTSSFVGQDDLNRVLQHWGATTPAEIGGLAVPEPGMAGLVAVLAAGSRRRRVRA
jgi:hypothetical protein